MNSTWWLRKNKKKRARNYRIHFRIRVIKYFNKGDDVNYNLGKIKNLWNFPCVIIFFFFACDYAGTWLFSRSLERQKWEECKIFIRKSILTLTLPFIKWPAFSLPFNLRTSRNQCCNKSMQCVALSQTSSVEITSCWLSI